MGTCLLTTIISCVRYGEGGVHGFYCKTKWVYISRGPLVGTQNVYPLCRDCFSHSFACAGRVQVLQLSHNAMESMPIALLSLPALTYLDLSYNRLMALPFWMGSSKLQQLKRLNLVRLIGMLLWHGRAA